MALVERIICALQTWLIPFSDLIFVYGTQKCKPIYIFYITSFAVAGLEKLVKTIMYYYRTIYTPEWYGANAYFSA